MMQSPIDSTTMSQHENLNQSQEPSEAPDRYDMNSKRKKKTAELTRLSESKTPFEDLDPGTATPDYSPQANTTKLINVRESSESSRVTPENSQPANLLKSISIRESENSLEEPEPPIAARDISGSPSFPTSQEYKPSTSIDTGISMIDLSEDSSGKVDRPKKRKSCFTDNENTESTHEADKGQIIGNINESKHRTDEGLNAGNTNQVRQSEDNENFRTPDGITHKTGDGKSTRSPNQNTYKIEEGQSTETTYQSKHKTDDGQNTGSTKKKKKSKNKSIIPWEISFNVEKTFTVIFLIFLGISVLVFALTSRISAHIVIWNLGPLYNHLFENGTIHGVTEISEQNECSLIRHAVWSLCIVMVAPCVFTIYETRYMLHYVVEEKKTKKKQKKEKEEKKKKEKEEKKKKEKEEKKKEKMKKEEEKEKKEKEEKKKEEEKPKCGIVLMIVTLDLLHFAIKTVLVLILLPAIDPYIAAVIYLFINPTPFELLCICKGDKDCCKIFSRIIALIAVACIVTAVIFFKGSSTFSALLLTFLFLETLCTFFWDHFANTEKNETKSSDDTASTTETKGNDQDENQQGKNINKQNKKAASASGKSETQSNTGTLTSKDSGNDQKDNHNCFQNKCLYKLSYLKKPEYYIPANGFASLAKVVMILIIGGIFHGLDIKTPLAENCNHVFPYYVAGINVGFSFMCYVFSKTACKILQQKRLFLLPLTISVFVTPFILYSLVHLDVPYFTEIAIDAIPISLNEMELKFESDLKLDVVLTVAFGMGFFSFIFSICHTYDSEGRPPGCNFRLFIKPLYNPFFIEQSLLLNRRRDDSVRKENSSETDSRPNLYICATMWHEQRKEMLQLINSIIGMDKDYDGTKSNNKTSKLEVHIIFDDAFDEQGIKLNRYVDDLRETLQHCLQQSQDEEDEEEDEEEDKKKSNGEDSESSNVELNKPVPKKTPYGGRLTWILPKKSVLHVHLKDSNKVKKKKRWSQIFYMRYIVKHLVKEKNYDPKNTFILTLDGDVCFKPKSVRLLWERMQKNETVGAACGRIHPKGSGPIVWFQKFEYALSHWLQKSTEHVLGCVLCSPGCFSLFRASAIDDTILKYSKTSKRAEEYVRYDQGEDRWYSKILLANGQKIEYCAASHAETYAPEGFFELFKQRRRWTPSTLGNVLAIIMKGKDIRTDNQYIKRFYIFYQVVLFVTSVLTPGTIFLLILGSIITAFPEIDPIVALIINVIPVSLFTFVCFVFNEKGQLYVAGLLSNIYALMMLAVFVGLLQISIEAGLCSVTSVFMIYVASVFFLTAVCHPKEFRNLFYGGVYFLAIPSTSMLMVIYALVNLHVVSWGTRESSKPAQSAKKKNMFRTFRNFICCKNDEIDPDPEQGTGKKEGRKKYKIKFDKQMIYQNTTDKSITVIWKLPEESVLDYSLMVTEKETGNAKLTKEIQGDKTHVEIQELKPNTSYIISLKPKFTSEKDLDVVERMEIKTKEKNYKKNTIDFKVSNTTDSSATVEWKTNENSFKKYHLEWREYDSRKVIDECDIIDDIQKKEISHLNPHTVYFIEITATKNEKLHKEHEVFTTKEAEKWFKSKDFDQSNHELEKNENNFLEQLKEGYLKKETVPVKRAQDEQRLVEAELLVLRNKVCVMFFMINIVFVAIIYILTHISAYQGTLSVALWCQSKDVAAQTKLEPISITFILMFGVLLGIQFVSMLGHRISTVIHVLASTKNKENELKNKGLAKK